MEEYKKRDNSFLTGLCITLGTIVIGLVSYIVYTTSFQEENNICEYNGWAYTHEETFEASDGCNVCSCNNGSVVCTSMACDEQD